MPSSRHRLSQFEFWPYWLFYTPVYLHLLAATVRKGSLSQLCVANPGIPFGGLLEYSKHDISEQLPQQWVPRTVAVPLMTPPEEAQKQLVAAGIPFPLIAKPDRGERGFMVEKLESSPELAEYLRRASDFGVRLKQAGLDADGERLLLQEYINEPQEFGVMYVRRPAARCGRITSIVHKELLAVEGDGAATLAELIRLGKRTRIHEAMLRELYAHRLHEVLPAGALLYLVEIGNHARGATFLDATDRASEQLLLQIEPLARSIEGFFVGRFDIRCRDLQALEAGEFHVIEVNGVNSEPAHIYDPSNTLVRAYRDLLRHWREVERIAWLNRRRGAVPPTLAELVAAVKRHNRRLAAYRRMP